jgi:hypothetical protein
MKSNSPEKNSFKSKVLCIIREFINIVSITTLICLAIWLLMHAEDVHAKTEIRVSKQPKIKNVYCDDSKMVPIYVKPTFTTILNFPVKPDSVVLGSQKLFSVDYIKSDLAINSLTTNSKTNLFVYLFGRRCGFELRTTHGDHDNLVLVRDPEENKIKVQIKSTYE